MIIVSACLLGENCKYNGGNNYHPNVVSYVQGQEALAICPSVNGCRIFGIGRGRNQFEKTDWAIRRDFERCRPRVG